MTPRPLREFLLNKLELFDGARVLDPGAGTGEFLRQAVEVNPKIDSYGWDIDKDILEVARINSPSSTFSVRSALEDYSGQKFDFVIGNPPYFEMKPDQKTKEAFATVISGRANIYALFFKIGLDALKPGGTLAYVVPPSMNAGSYFRNLREYLVKEHRVMSLKVFQASDLFHDAQTSVQVIVIKKEKGLSNHTLEFSISGRTTPFFFENIDTVSDSFKGARTLWDLGYEAVTGNVVWNKFKDNLSNEASEKCLPLFYARNIQNGLLEIRLDEKKPQFLPITCSKPYTGPSILVNRIIGGVGKGVINSALVGQGVEFFAENHLNVIRPRLNVEQECTLDSIYMEINKPMTLDAARLITGNTQLSATEWNHLIPFKL